MALSNTTPGVQTVTGMPGYDDYAKKIQDAAAKTRTVGGDIKPLTNYTAKPYAGKSYDMGLPGMRATTLSGAQGALVGSLAGQAKTQQGALESQAEKAASALEMTGATTLKSMQALDTIAAGVKKNVSEASGTWSAAAEKADEYVKASRGRVDEVLKKLDAINTSIAQDNDFAKAHEMQAGVQAVMGSMKDEERNISQNYGTDSKEYQQFQASKKTTLATVQSNIQSNFSKIRAQQQENYLAITSDAYTKSNMYVGYQEQQHVEMLKYQESNRQQYALQGAQLEATLEQMKMSGMENLANWIVQSPTFTMDITPTLVAIAQIERTAEEENQAYTKANFVPYHRTTNLTTGEWGPRQSIGT